MKSSRVQPSLIQALIPLTILIILLATSVMVFEDSAIEGANQMSLLFGAIIAGLIGVRLGYKWEEIQEGAVKSISSAMGAILILLFIGSLSGTWMISGIVPAMIYYGLKILNPSIFLFAACAVSAIVSLATGSSWSTIATLGIALLGIGKAMGMSEGIVAGAIISGAYFGDKMSPLSDTTNLAPAMAGTDLFTHVRYMVYTTAPTMTITLIIFLIMGFTMDHSNTGANVSQILTSIQGSFNINGWLFIVPALVIFLIVKKVPALPALIAGTVAAAIFALIFQYQAIEQVSGITGNPIKASFVAIWKSMYTQISITTDNAMVTDLLTSKGMSGMLNTIWLIVCAMVFGGVMEATGMLQRIAMVIVGWAKSSGSLIASTAVSCAFFNVTASDQYLAIVVPGRMFRNAFKDKDLKPEVLSRTLEDSGTVTSVLVPWNTCGATQSSVLGVSTMTYAPYCFFNIISPFMTMLFGYLNIKIRRYSDDRELKKAA